MKADKPLSCLYLTSVFLHPPHQSYSWFSLSPSLLKPVVLQMLHTGAAFRPHARGSAGVDASVPGPGEEADGQASPQLLAVVQGVSPALLSCVTTQSSPLGSTAPLQLSVPSLGQGHVCPWLGDNRHIPRIGRCQPTASPGPGQVCR